MLDILHRNVALYKDEESFTTYLIELAVYLLEYEYDWSESGAEPPPNLRQRPEETTRTTNQNVTPTGAFVTSKINPTSRIAASRRANTRICPHCGNETPTGKLVCAHCNNLVG